MKTYYSVLNCEDEKSLTQKLKFCYFKQLRKLHPDKNLNKVCNSNQIDNFVLINQAWSVLSDPLRRQKYDYWLEEQRLRQSKELIGLELDFNSLNLEDENFVEQCRCGGEFCIESEELKKILDFAFFECSNCSLLLKIVKNI